MASPFPYYLKVVRESKAFAVQGAGAGPEQSRSVGWTAGLRLPESLYGGQELTERIGKLPRFLISDVMACPGYPHRLESAIVACAASTFGLRRSVSSGWLPARAGCRNQEGRAAHAGQSWCGSAPTTWPRAFAAGWKAPGARAQRHRGPLSPCSLLWTQADRSSSGRTARAALQGTAHAARICPWGSACSVLLPGHVRRARPSTETPIDHNQSLHPVRLESGNAEGDACSPGVSNNSRSLNAQLIERPRYVPSQGAPVIASGRLGSLAVGALIQGNDPEAFTHVWDDQVVPVRGGGCPVQDNHRPPCPRPSPGSAYSG